MTHYLNYAFTFVWILAVHCFKEMEMNATAFNINFNSKAGTAGRTMRNIDPTNAFVKLEKGHSRRLICDFFVYMWLLVLN